MKLKDILDEFDSAKEPIQRDSVQGVETLGPFTLQEKIGEGAFGTVWRAQQSAPVQREVALKILKIGMDTEEVLARFEQERQTLALMDHPNIAQVFDAGASQAGRPYFVMELVHAKESLTRYCQERSLPLEKRIQLFREACLAIQHAHQKGIIHRDIKPSNILVSSEDPPRVKVIDFGIAKVIANEDSPNLSFRTRADRFMGTPAYMSPEQLADSRDVDTRSDVYSLGVILYELLTDTLPFDAETTLTKERSTVTKRPSLQSTKETKSELRGDLDCITLKCLEGDRQRRYQSPADLVADLDRYLTHQPILARPPEGLYLASQFYKRHKAAVLGAFAFVSALFLGLIVTGVMYQKEQKARKVAQLESKKSRETIWFLSEILSSAGYSKSLGRDASMMQDLLQDALVRIEEDQSMEPEVELEIRRILGATFLDLEDYGDAVNQFVRVHTLIKQTQPEAIHDQAKALFELADALECDNQIELAEKSLLEILTIEKNHPDLFAKQPVRYQARMLLAWIHLGNEQLEQADHLASECYQQWLTTPEEDAYETFPTVYATVLTKLDRRKEAEAVYRAELALRRETHPTPYPLKVKALVELGQSLVQTGEYSESRLLLLESLEEGRIVFGAKNPHGDQALSLLARVAQSEGDSAQALVYLRKAMRAAQLAYPPEAPYRISSVRKFQNALLHQASQALEKGDFITARQHLAELEELATSQSDLKINPSKLEKLRKLIESSDTSSTTSSQGH